MDFAVFVGGEKTLVYRRGQGIVLNAATEDKNLTEFLRPILKKLGSGPDCLLCVGSSWSVHDVDDFREHFLAAGAVDVAVIPTAVAGAVGAGYDVTSKDEILSVVTEGNWADVCVIHHGEIIDGGTIENLEKLERAKKQLLQKHPNIPVFTADRITVINGAGKLLSDEKTLKRIIKSN